MPNVFTRISERQSHILAMLRQKSLSSSQVQAGLQEKVSPITVKRDLAALVEAGCLRSLGAGRAVTYVITVPGLLFAPVDARAYNETDVDRRNGFTRFNADLFPAVPASIFSPEEVAALNAATEAFQTRASETSETIARRELERFVIELSWKSSRIEGNTYTLLDTERLIREGIEAEGRSHDDAVMILNHKKAFTFVMENRHSFSGTPTVAAVREVHKLLVDGLRVSDDIRNGIVGITGSAYRPPDIRSQIIEALESVLAAVGAAADPYSAALIALAGVSYVQPFEDGNKRTARLVANAVLLARRASPLSYRSVDESAYREATLAFYETNSIVPIKEIFASQYLFAAEQYGIRP